MFKFTPALLAATSALLAAAAASTCRCGPADACWPSQSQWSALNSTVAGQLIATQPVAISCYPGPEQNDEECEYVDAEWTNPLFQSLSPVGLSYPSNVTCPPVNLTAGEVPGTCTIGNNPRYAVNATTVADVAAAINFARNSSVRLVIKDTGHDILGRSDGYGSLEVWIKYLRTGLSFQEKFAGPCTQCNWTGPTITIGGGYTWIDVYPLAEANNVVVVGGGTPSVSSLGGWMQGGGHGPASRQYGLGADQVLSATVVLANGSVVTASPCENPDLYFAIRGGGPGSYGVVVETVIKAWPMVDVQVQHVAIAPLTSNYSTLYDAITILFSALPDLNDAGYAGYGTWTIAGATPLFADFYQGYVHGIYMFNQTLDAAEDAFNTTLAKLNALSGLYVDVSYVSYSDYWSFYYTESGVEGTAGSTPALGSRLFSRADVQKNTTGLREMVEIIAGTADEYTSNNFEVVSGGAVFKDAADPYSGLNPAWRYSYFSNIVARGWAAGTPVADQEAILYDITYVKTKAMKDQAPETGAYMNEADRNDPEWAEDFYGLHYLPLLAIKQKYDPNGVFYCPTCMGSASWAENSEGVLCKVSS